MTPPEDDPASFRAAFSRGQTLLAEGDRSSARSWFERAYRLAKTDPTAKFMLATVLAGQDDGRAERMFAELADAFPHFRECRLALIAAALRASDPGAARDQLDRLLRTSGFPLDDGFARLARQVCRDAGEPGWMIVRSDGTASIALSDDIGGKVVLRLDGGPERTVANRAGRASTISLARSWRLAQTVSATHNGRPLLGSPVALEARRYVEGFFDVTEGGALQGWAWHPADPATPPRLVISVTDSATGRTTETRIVPERDDPRTLLGRELERRRVFALAASELPKQGLVTVRTPDGADLAGSPLDIGGGRYGSEASARRIAASHGIARSETAPSGADVLRPLPVAHLPPIGAAVTLGGPAQRKQLPPVDVIIPVYRGAQDFVDCLASLSCGLPSGSRIVVVDDASPDVDLRAKVDAAERRGAAIVIRHTRNLGFPASVNTGLRHAAASSGKRDVLLLNSDTVLPPGAIRRLAEAAHAALDIASVTPMTDDGTIASYRMRDGDDLPDRVEVGRRDRLFAEANGQSLVELPTAVGFCMYVRGDSVREVGLFRDDVFAQGYAEENDWCLRARHLGWRHVLAVGLFVAHRGGRSFGALKLDLIARNLRRLNALHPGYDELIATFQKADPVAPFRRAVDVLRWTKGRVREGAVVLLTHDLGGGVARHIRERCAVIREEGLRPVVLRPVPGGVAIGDRLGSDGGTESSEVFDDLLFDLPGREHDLSAFLRAERPRRIELHHTLGHVPAIVSLLFRLRVPLDVFIHDSAVWCPRVSLLNWTGKYCGEPSDVAECEACVADLGSRLDETITVADLRARSAGWLARARRVVVACDDAGRRIARQFPGIRPVVEPWELDAAIPFRPASGRPNRWPANSRARIVALGAIGKEKGYDVLLACARDAALRDLPLEFVLVGFSVDDGRLMRTGRVFVTGRYDAEEEGVALVRAQHGDLGFIPSVWPETWCYALTGLWLGGLDVVSFALGAQAERISKTGRGSVLPLGLPASRINDTLLRVVHAGTDTGMAGVSVTPAIGINNP